MQHSNAQRLLHEAQQEFDLYNDNVQILNVEIANLNRTIHDNRQHAQDQSQKIAEPLERQTQKFTSQAETEYQKAKQRVEDIRRLFTTEETKFRTIETTFEKQRADFERQREEFAKKQQLLQTEEQRFRDAQQKYNGAVNERGKLERSTQSKIDNVISHAEFERKRLERTLEQKQRELRTAQVKAQNARRNVDIFTRDITNSMKKADNDSHAPGRQLYNRL